MPLVEDVLDWCVKVNKEVSSSGREIKLMLDIKSDNEPKFLMKKIWDECQKKRLDLSSDDTVKYWKNKLILGLWNSNFYDPEISSYFTVVNITFDVKVAKKFYKEVKEKNPSFKLHAVSMINLILYRYQDKKELIEWANQENIKLWFWTVNENSELHSIIKLCSLPNGKSLLEGVVTDDPVKLLDESDETISKGWRCNLRWWVKTRIYALFLFMFRGGYNLHPMIYFLKSIGFL